MASQGSSSVVSVASWKNRFLESRHAGALFVDVPDEELQNTSDENYSRMKEQVGDLTESNETGRVAKVKFYARQHGRYMTTEGGVMKVVEKVEKRSPKKDEYMRADCMTSDGGVKRVGEEVKVNYLPCPRFKCSGQMTIPVAWSEPGGRDMKMLMMYCPRCNDYYHPPKDLNAHVEKGQKVKKVLKAKFFDAMYNGQPYYYEVIRQLRTKGAIAEMERFEPTMFGFTMKNGEG